MGTAKERARLRKLFKRHRGAAARAAREAGVSAVTVHQWLRNKMESARVAAAVAQVEEQLILDDEGGSNDVRTSV